MSRLALFLMIPMVIAPRAQGQAPASESPATPPAQAPAAPSQPQATPPAPAPSAATAPAATPPAAGASTPASPVPSTESWLTGTIDLGYRWRTDVGGSFDAYRSIVDLGSGPKLLGVDLTLIDPKHRFFDQVQVRAYNWGGDPYQTFHLDAKKSKLYDFSADYRDIAYFNALPSFADPLLSVGTVLDEQSFDTHRSFGSFQLTLLPGNWFIPYLAYDRDSMSGDGVTTFVTDANTFPVLSTMRNLTHLYRGGVRFELRRFHATIEQGGTTFNSDQTDFQNPGTVNAGNVTTPVFGETSVLTGLLAAYGVGGSSIYTKALFSANPTPWLDLYGQFLFSQPDTSVNYQQAATGNFLLQSQLLFYTGQQYLVSAEAKLPHTSGSFGAEIRPLPRLRIVESWLTDRLHNAGSAASSQTILGAGTSQDLSAMLASSLVTNYNQAEIQAFYQVTPKITVRGGYRYVWGDVSDAVLPPAGLVSSDEGHLRRNVALGGVTYRPAQKLSLTADAEVASSGGAYFRTSLYDYQKVRAQARYQAFKNLNIAADFTALLNNNPAPSINSSYRLQQESVSLFWSPAKIWDLEGSYTRSTIYSDIGYLDPGSLQPETSLYRDDAHIATALFNLNLARVTAGAKITAGGSLFISSGSRPSTYYQPLATLWLPIGKKLNWFAEWRYYGYGEAFYLYEGFRTNLVTTGVRITR